MTTYVNQTHLAELFGLSFEEMEKILIKYGLKSGELATQKAIDNCYAHLTVLGNGQSFYHWNIIKISELAGMKLVDEVGFYVSEVMRCFQDADEQSDLSFALLIATHAYDKVPEALRNEVQKRVDRKIIGDRRQACEKCGRMTFWRVKGFCWRCLPDDPFIQMRLDYEADARKAAAQLARANWGTLYTDNNLEPMETDIMLWNDAFNTSIDSFLARLVDPSKCDKRLAGDIIDESTYGQALAEFVYSRLEDHCDWARCRAFLDLAYKTVASVLTKEVNDRGMEDLMLQVP